MNQNQRKSHGCPTFAPPRRTWAEKEGAAQNLQLRESAGVPHISLVFCEMWDTTVLHLQPVEQPRSGSNRTGCPTFAAARRTWAEKEGAAQNFQLRESAGVPHISLVFCEMWDTTVLHLQPLSNRAVEVTGRLPHVRQGGRSPTIALAIRRPGPLWRIRRLRRTFPPGRKTPYRSLISI
jgi:hypothetical protein